MGLTTAIDDRTPAYQYALQFRSWGWSVFPVHRKKPVIRAWTCRTVRYGPDAGMNDRVRLTGWKKFQTYRPSEAVIHQMFSPKNAGRIDGLAVVLGPVSGGLCVRDFDSLDGYRAWAEAHLHLARRLPTAMTGRGVHVYFRLPHGHGPVYRKLPSGRDRGELLGDNKHYVVLPPSRHPHGRNYEWREEPVSVEDFPILYPVEAGFLDEGRPQTRHEDGRDRGPKAVPKIKTSSVAKTTVRTCEESERDFVLQCLPTGPGERNDRLWELARSLKALPHLADAAAQDLRPCIETWYVRAAPVIRTKSFETCWADFVRQWSAVRVPMGAGFDRAVQVALTGPCPPEVDGYKDEATKRLVAVSATLQVYAGTGPFFLSCRTAARVCGFGSYHTAARRIRSLVEEGLLTVVEHGEGGTARRRASRYRWLGFA